jgi:hypothetical protein
MPYFFIMPVYFMLFAGLLVVSGLVRLWPRFRWVSAHLWSGAIGTLSGVLAGNIVFWCVLMFFLLLVRQVPVREAGDAVRMVLTVGLVTAAGVGLAVANVAGCVAGFVAGVWWRVRENRRASALASSAE